MGIYANIENKVKKFVLEEYESTVKHAKTADDVYNNSAIAYGALQFSVNNLFPCYNSDLARWGHEQLDKFNKLALDKQNKS